MNRDNASFLIGLAMKAGKLKSGDFACMSSIRDGTACLILLAEDSSENTKKKFCDKCSFYGVPLIQRYTKSELGKRIGKEERAVAAITDKGLAEAIRKKIAETADEKGKNM